MANRFNCFPSPDFWKKYRRHVLVDLNGAAWFTREGHHTLRAALNDMGVAAGERTSVATLNCDIPHVADLTDVRTVELAQFKHLPIDSPERELAAEMLGLPVTALPLPADPAPVVDLLRWRVAQCR